MGNGEPIGRWLNRFVLRADHGKEWWRGWDDWMRLGGWEWNRRPKARVAVIHVRAVAVLQRRVMRVRWPRWRGLA